jgi:DNA-binding LytR/AlgR family response regulator
MVGLRTEDIHYVEALKDYVGIHVAGKRYVVHSTMNDIERRLPAGRFMRVHRSFIVRLDRIEAIEHADLVLEKNDQVIPIGNLYLGRLRERLALI